MIPVNHLDESTYLIPVARLFENDKDRFSASLDQSTLQLWKEANVWVLGTKTVGSTLPPIILCTLQEKRDLEFDEPYLEGRYGLSTFIVKRNPPGFQTKMSVYMGTKVPVVWGFEDQNGRFGTD